MTDRFYVYVHKKPSGEPFYVGKGKKCRAWEMRSSCRNKHWNNTADKYGVGTLLVEIFDCSSEKASFNLEIELISYYRGLGFPLVNMTDGGEGTSGHPLSKEHKAKLSARFKGRPPHPNLLAGSRKAHLGAKRSAETKAKISAIHKGRKRSAQTAAKMLKVHLGRKNTLETINKMKTSAKNRQPAPPISDETKAKMRASHKNRPSQSLETKLKRIATYKKTCLAKKVLKEALNGIN